MAPTTAGSSSSHRIGQLCVGGDWACAHGDLDALRYVAQRLANEASKPLDRELLALADMCHADPDHAAEAWPRLKNQMLRRS